MRWHPSLAFEAFGRLLLIGLLLTACPPAEPAEEPPPPPEAAGSHSDCELMCKHLVELKCDFVTADCVNACDNVEQSGITTVCPSAVSQATSCADAKRRSRCDE
jgi:hypothetical protein